jgi:hypothetical protein
LEDAIKRLVRLLELQVLKKLDVPYSDRKMCRHDGVACEIRNSGTHRSEPLSKHDANDAYPDETLMFFSLEQP